MLDTIIRKNNFYPPGGMTLTTIAGFECVLIASVLLWPETFAVTGGAALNAGILQIKGYGTFSDTTGTISSDQLAIYLNGVSDTGTFMLTNANYMVYNQLLPTPEYFSTQAAKYGFVHITILGGGMVSGNFECKLNNTNTSATLVVKSGVFTDILLQ